MSPVFTRLRRIFIATALITVGASIALAQSSGRGVLIEIDGAIGAGTADYIHTSLAQAAEENVEVVILRMDTPGGLDLSMREIIKEILASPVPVVTWVAPGGSRADSAGTYILLASHVAAMATTTHLGAATPVSMLGGSDKNRPPLPGGVPTPGQDSNEPAEPAIGEEDAEPASGGAMERKIMNDAIAYIRGLAESRGRNADWAESAVRDAATLTSREALEQNVIEFIADDMAALLDQLDGRTVTLPRGEVTLATADITIDSIEPTWRQTLLSTIASPEIAILLLFAGIYGLVFEGWNPGAIVPGVVGAICLLLAAYALNVMPVNYAGLGLIVLGAALIVAEVFVPSFGALGIGGVASIMIGSVMMFDTGVPGFQISYAFVATMALVLAAAIFAIGYYAARMWRRGAVSGREQILKDVATANESFADTGTVWLEGEEWQARTKRPVTAGDQLRVLKIDGLVLEVEPLTVRASESSQSELHTQ